MARFADVNDPRTCAKYWYAACEVIIRELFYNGTCRVPTLGTFTTKHIGESIQVQKELMVNKLFIKCHQGMFQNLLHMMI